MLFPFVLLFLAMGITLASESRFTNIECKMLDPSYAIYEQCELKILGRGIVGLNVHVTLKKGPFNNAKVNMSLWRKFNGYHPFLVNSTFDFCKIMEKSTKKLSFEKVLMDYLYKNSNFNHSCPYDNDLIVKNLVFDDDYFEFLPWPTGQYRFRLMAGTNNDWKTVIDIHFVRSDH